MNKNRGQSLVEVVFAIAVIALTLSGVVSLLVYSVGSRTKSFDRKRATELGEKVMEQLVDEEKNSPLAFWRLSNRVGLTDTEFGGYVCSVGFTNIVNGSTCGVGRTDCTEVVLTVGWSGSTNQQLNFNRFFSRR